MILRNRLNKFFLFKYFVEFTDSIKLPGYKGFSIFDLLEMYFLGIVKGALTARAGSISFSFFMAIFPFLLFILNLIPFIPIENFDSILLNFIEILLPNDSQGFFSSIFQDIQSKPRGGLLSSVFLLSIILTANGVSAIFAGFEESYHIELSRNFFKQYLYSMGVAVLLAFTLLIAVVFAVYFEIYIYNNIKQLLENTVNWLRLGQSFFYIFLIYFSVSILYYFGTIEGKKSNFFSPGALMTTLLIMITTWLFGIYIENFATYNQLYGSIGALLIFMLYIWLNSNVLLLGFELNATLMRLKNEIPKKE
ncbi:MAG: ribonuclease BN [Flavobacteriaceae bacterium]|nr:ribonuclease BN [Flavobacteriaceae bacterium]MAH82237.1 ribonuclease BN [Flavobacteriaceae bacterium]MBQ22444.1 ribonuclease BN [Flavobacteriales bacterium]|tara:strand:- start:3305 stop:4225 length:921 start_codon:yes stop_codon:yes gene_type:complete